MKGGVDQGFCYWSLSYRRKFIRTMWMAPWVIVAALAVVAMDTGPDRTGSWLYSLAALVLLLAQGAYNYLKWRSDERSEQGG